ncbi:MAG: phosphatase PAP2 family protein, partial [bacterium]
MLFEKTLNKDLIPRVYRHKHLLQKYELKSSFRLVDYATFSYLGILALLLLFFYRGVSQWPLFVLAHVMVIGFLLFFIRYVERNPSKILTLFRDWYPLFLYPFLFKETSLIINIFFPFWLEPWLIKWDYALLGSHPTVWLQQYAQPWLTEFMAFSYWSYYVLIPVGALVLYLRKDKTLFRSFVFTLSLSLYICYFSFLFLTARGPHETLAYLHMDRAVAGLFDNLVRTIQNQASVSGAAFPSSHVLAVWVVLIFMFKYNKWVGWALTPLILSLSFSVVYMQYHYAVDSVAGIMLVCLTYPLGRFLEKVNR